MRPRLVLLDSSNQWVLSNLVHPTPMLVRVHVIIPLADEPVHHPLEVITLGLEVTLIIQAACLFECAVLKAHLGLSFLIYHRSSLKISSVPGV